MVCVGKCNPGASYYHEDSLLGDIISAKEGYANPHVYDQWSCPNQPARRGVAPYIGAYANSRDALLADSDHLAYSRPCHRRDFTAGTPELIYRCYRGRPASLSLMTTGRAQQAEDGPRRRRRRRSRDSMSLSRAGRSSWRTWAGATSRYAD